jgi:U2 small nuclear ribonucleoprotein A'
MIRLSLLNNPITQAKNYRVYVISRIPSLKVLDFQKVSKKVIYNFYKFLI